MVVQVVLGAQWGDEGKGKLVDILAQEAGICARAAGGNNAGHTIQANGITYDFHILPSGLINPSCRVNIIGPGCVVHIPSFFRELDALEAKGLVGVRDRIYISDRAHVCFDLHAAVDGIVEDASGKMKIGTTRRGIGPVHADKVGRRGVPLWMLVGSGENGEGRWEQRLRALAAGYEKLYGIEVMRGYDLEDEVVRMKQYRQTLANFVIMTTPLLSAATDGSSQQSQNILVEDFSANFPLGANALMLDIDHGSFPFVTSSSTGIAGVFGLAGLSLAALTSPGSAIIGVVKAYTTRVGSGPFPTELNADPDDSPPLRSDKLKEKDAHYGEKLQRIGKEVGVTTGRKRRVGWLDLLIVKYSCQVNSYTHINLTKLDILDSFEEIRVATAYRLPPSTLESADEVTEEFDDQAKSEGEEVQDFPADLDLLQKMSVVYRTFPGWQSSTSGCQHYEDLPARAKEYVEYIEKEVNVPIKWIGTGPKREDMIVR